jgi:hypothetical protein
MLPTFNKNPENLSLKKHTSDTEHSLISASTHATGGSKYDKTGATIRNDTGRRNSDSSVGTVSRVWVE